MSKTLELGEVAVVGDPCYFPNGHTTAVDVVPGRWFAWAELSDEGEWGIRVSELRLRLEGVMRPRRWEHIADLGVDSGQMMVIDADSVASWVDEEFALVRNHQGGYDVAPNLGFIGELSYNGACWATLTSTDGVLGDKAYVTSTGYGDGVYSLFIARETLGKGPAVALRVKFIDEEEAE